MLKRTLSLLLGIFLLNVALAPMTLAKTKETGKKLTFIEKLRANIQNQGVGIDSKIQVKLKDGTKLKGYVSEADNEQFTVIDAKTGQATQVPYPQVKQAKGNNWSQKHWIGVVIATGILVALLIAVATAKD